MNTQTAAPQQTSPQKPKLAPPETRGKLSFARLIRSEWIKFTTLRSTWWSLALVAVISIGLSLIQAAAIASFTDDGRSSGGDHQWQREVVVILFSTVLTQLLAIIIGTINVTGEYSTGMIRSTLTAAPDRMRSLFAKVLVLSITMFVFRSIVFAVAGLVTGPDPADRRSRLLRHLDTSLWPLLAAALYIALLMTALGVGSRLHHQKRSRSHRHRHRHRVRCARSRDVLSA